MSHDVVVFVLAWLHDYTLFIVNVVIQFSFITEQEWRSNTVIPGSFLSLALLDMVGRCCFTTVGINLSLWAKQARIWDQMRKAQVRMGG